MRDALWQVDKDQPVGAVRTMDEPLSNSLTRRRFSVTLLVPALRASRVDPLIALRNE